MIICSFDCAQLPGCDECQKKLNICCLSGVEGSDTTFNFIDLYMKGYTYILLCADDSYYTGSTINLAKRFEEHQNGQGANHTKNRLPVKLVYFEEFPRIDNAYFREKQIQGWTRKKKEALINGLSDELKKAAECLNETHHSNYRKK